MDARLIRHLASLWRRSRHSPAVSTAPSLVIPRSPGFALEPRIMLDAALIDTGAEALNDPNIQQNKTGSEPQANNAELAEALDSLNPPATSNSVILIDPSVPDYEALLANVPENTDVHLLSASASLAEIADVLANYQNLDAVHIISHGSSGALFLSGETVNSESVELHQETLAAIGQSLNEEGDILLYGCNVGSDGAGLAFIERLSELTDADVAASDDMTGSLSRGGDWDLEVTTGESSQTPLEFASYQGVLPTIGFDGFVAPSANQPLVGYSEAGVTIDISTTQQGLYEFNKYTGGTGALSGAYIDLYHRNPGGDITVTFDSSVDLTSIVLGSAFDDYVMTLTPIGGANASVTTGTIVGGIGGATMVSLNWSSVTGFTIEGADWGVYLDNFVLADAAPANSAPSLTGLPSHITVTEDTQSNLDLSAATFSDANGDTITVTLTLDSGKFSSLADGIGVGSGVTEIKVSDTEITLQGLAEDINSYLDTASNIQYTGAENDSGNEAATLTVSATDGSDAMDQASAKINITAVNDDPTADSPASVTVTEDTSSNLDLSALSFGDEDNFSNLTVTLTVDHGAFDWLVNLPLTYGVDATLVNSKTVTLEGTEAKINDYLDGVSNIRYIGAQNASGFGADSITVTANDGNGSGDVNLGTININITAVNDIPVVDSDPDNSSGGVDGYKTTFAAGSSSGVTVVDTDFTITDVDDTNLASAVITLGGVKNDGNESISIDGMPASVNDITITYTSATQINLSGSATKADYEAVIKQVKYSNNAAAVSTTAGDRTINITVNDGEDPSASEESTVSVISAPIVNVGSGATYVENDLNTPVSLVSASASITDIDSANLNGMVINISNAKTGDKISLFGRSDGQTVNGISITYNSDSQITLANSATKADYLSLLKELQFSNSSQNPDTTNRTLSILTTDTDNNTGTTSTTVVVQGVNDDPVATNDTGSVNEDATLTITKANGVVDSHGSDDDGDSLTVSAVRTGAESGSGTSGTVGTGLTGTYGTLTLNADGSYSYVADQAAADALNINEDATDIFTFTLSDGQGGTDTAEIVITVNGTNDAAVLSVGNKLLTETNAILSTSGTLTNSDVDNANAFQTQTNEAGNYGTFNIGTDGAWSYVANSVFDSLDAGDVISDTFSVTAADGTQTSVKVIISGSNDASVVSGTYTGSVTEGDAGDAPVTATGSLSISDVDDDDAPSFADRAAIAGDQGYGSFVLSAGQWTYTLDQSKVQQLSTGQQVSDSIDFTATDGTVQTITVTITGTNDAAVVISADVPMSETNEAVSTGGTLTSNDVDNANTFEPQSNVAGSYGTFNIDVNGNWTYVANSAFDALDAGDSVSDNFVVKSTDGTETRVKVTINGSDDVSVISGTFTGTVTEGSAGSPAASVTGTLDISDPDTSDNPSFADQAAVVGDQGYGSFALNEGQWIYTLNPSAVQNLNAGEQLSDTFTFVASDGTQQVVAITILGTSEAPIVQQPSDTTPPVSEPVLEFAPEPAIPDPVRQGDGNIVTALAEGQPAETPASDIDAGAGNAADTVKNEQGLISSGSVNTKAFTVQGLFNQQGALDVRYGSNLVTNILSVLPSSAQSTNTISAQLASILSSFGYEAEQSEVLLEDDTELEEEDERDQPASEKDASDSDSEGEEPLPESPDRAEIPTRFSDYLALAVDHDQDNLMQLNKALMTIAETK
ncbi:hypothetical protein GZ77_16470 [Endozoicomonas montiporae]|uniref:DUF4347 domain-containing protein n=2 Tax=Endozoicomonas montiporae TaxID=1027273 RepID=A0A081N5Y4_9GAMM|nr:VCBS domain-containing protein [Endozoicomonas montiporae]AMO57234.1 hypothetical protein EZMO1_3234 [Endozoicomonas montiporae CL-33]KEQ13857.1 hypothetical protein GZ77_16470 [Endozoicomonas montiporae]